MGTGPSGNSLSRGAAVGKLYLSLVNTHHLGYPCVNVRSRRPLDFSEAHSILFLGPSIAYSKFVRGLDLIMRGQAYRAKRTW